jgi:GNAT superfamily N-acetyltransferase
LKIELLRRTTVQNTEKLVTTYLEMRMPAASSSQRSQVTDQRFEIREWTDEQWQEYAHDPMLRTFAGYYGGEVVGYFELRRSAASPSRGQRSAVTRQKEEEVEIAYFGLLPDFIGRRLGGALLTSAIENAWGWTPTPSRVWVHTCNRDHPNALANYKARGFRVYKIEEEPLRRA